MSRRSNFRNFARRTTRVRHNSLRSHDRRPLRLEPLEDRRLLAVVTVTTALDTIDFNDGVISLREAIFATNLVTGADEIHFDFGHDGPATIVLTQGELKITDSLTIEGSGADLLAIDASGNDPTPDVNDNRGSRIFYIDDGDSSPTTLIDVSLSGVSLTGGDLKISPPNPSLPNGLGGAIASSARLTLSDTSIFGNYADRGGGVGVFAGTLAVVSSDISNNSARFSGGGIGAFGGMVSIAGSTIADNVVTQGGAQSGGGGILVSKADLTIDESIVSGNRVVGTGHGGGINFNPLYATASLEIRHSTISGNSTSQGSGGGVSATTRNGHILLEDNAIDGNMARRYGGGVRVTLYEGSATIHGNLVRNNSAGEGGGVYATATGGEIRIEASTISNNVATGVNELSGGGDGGGLFIRNQTGAAAIVHGTTIQANSSTGNGGGIRSNGAIKLIESSLTENFATVRGSAIYTSAGVMLGQSVVSGNTTAITVRQGASTLYANGDVSLVETTVRNNAGHGIVGRNVTLSDSIVTGNSGAGISARYAVTADRSDVSNNAAVGVSTRDGNVTIHDSTIAGNGSAGISAGIYSSPAIVVVASSILDNLAGIITTGDVSLLRSSVTGNVNNSFFSAGIFARGNVTLDQSTVSGNTALGIYTRGAGVYGGRSVTLNQSTVSGNTSSERGGGIASYGNIAIRYSTVANNAAGLIGGGIHSGNPQYHDLRIEIVGSIVAGNTAVGGKPDVEPGASTLDVQYSLIGDQGGTTLLEAPVDAPDANGNLIGGPIHGVIDPFLAPLADNGGPTFTHALMPGSPAINRGDLNAAAGVDGVPEFDQRGEPFGRIFGGRIDVGAFEYQAASDLNLLVDTLVDENDGDVSRGDLSLREAIELANTFDGHDTIRFDTALTTAGPAAILLTMGELAITDSVTINGPGADLLTLDASGNDPTPDSTLDDGNAANDGDGSRIFAINAPSGSTGLNVTLAGLTLTGGDSFDGGAIANAGNLTLVDSVIRNNVATGNGGGIAMNSFPIWELTILRSTIRDNSSRRAGGGVWGPSITLSVTDSLVEGNKSRDGGGGIFATGSNHSIIDSTIRNNSAGSELMFDPPLGGGIRLGGVATISNSNIEGNSAAGGGGIFVVSGRLTVHDSIITGNTAYSPYGYTLLGGSAGGGGILSRGLLVITDSVISGNSSNFHGGGIAFNGSRTDQGVGALTIVSSSISGNSAVRIGGRVSGVGISISESTIDGNTAEKGGGLYLRNSSIERSTISNNTAEAGGGLWIHGSTITQSTISGNTAVIGAGIYSNSGGVVRHSTVAFNTASSIGSGIFVNGTSLTLDHTIVAQNAGNNRDLNGLLGSNIVATYSLIGMSGGSGLTPAPVGSPDANGNLIGSTTNGIWANLAPLADNGGPTKTHALGIGSPALNAGNLNAMAGVGGVPLHDQRGEPFIRIYGGRIDVGAIELLPAGFLPGDYNHDGVVDAADYSMWRSEMDMTVTPGTGGDGNGDGLVNALDYELWKQNFGATVDDLPSALSGAAALASREANVAEPAPVRGSRAAEAVALVPSSGVATRRFAGPQLVRKNARIAAATIVDDGIVAWSLTRRFARGRDANAVDHEKPARCATEVSPSDSAFDRAFELLVPLV